jgi:serine O-acetyltransferase
MRAVRPLYNLIYPFVQALTGIEIWPETQIGPGLRIYHGGNIVINPATRVGANCVLRQGVTLGVLGIGQTDCPTIGDGVEFGAYVQVLGGVTIGAGAKVGAMSVVLADVPPGKTAVGAPARVID